MEHYVTLFDSLFLPQGLTLHTSMQRHIKNYILWILCVDDNTHDVLSRLKLPNVRLLRLSQLETESLLRIKPDRNIGEYCWTLTPFAPRFVFEADENVKRVTYLDADLWFRKSPAPIFREFEKSGKQVLITDHAYAWEHDRSETSGQYCVQFLIFTREGETVRQWWEDRCIEWCYARFEDGKFGDQKYLDNWPEQFADLVHVLANKELLMAPWNATRFPYGNSVGWHFHGFRVLKFGAIILFIRAAAMYAIPRSVENAIYKHYEIDIVNALATLTRTSQATRWHIKNQGTAIAANVLRRIMPRSLSASLLAFYKMPLHGND
jgi:hypothetical protein